MSKARLSVVHLGSEENLFEAALSSSGALDDLHVLFRHAFTFLERVVLPGVQDLEAARETRFWLNRLAEGAHRANEAAVDLRCALQETRPEVS